MVELKLSGVRKHFGATTALAGVDLECRGGEVLALIGENGAGKSTLMKVLSGAIMADEGRLTIDGVEFKPRSPAEARSAGVAMIYQELSLLPNLTVAENIVLGSEPLRAGLLLSRAAMAGFAREALAAVGCGAIDPDKITGQLPISVQQLIEIAKAARSGARIFVFDEPTSSLTREDVEKLFKIIRGLKARGDAVIYISHFLDEVKTIADRYCVLRDGATVAHGLVADVTTGELVTKMVGRELSELYPRTGRSPGEAIARISHFGQTLELRRGEVVGIAGLVGSGRTRLLRELAGLSGDKRIAEKLPRAGLVSENRKEEGLALGLTIAENLVLSRPVRPKARFTAATHWISRLNIRCREPGQRIGELSGGNQQKVAIARLLHEGVELFLLDEPTRGIDVGAKAEIYRLIDELACEGKAVLMVSSYLPELLGVCDRIAVMAKGRLGQARASAEWTESSLLTEALG